MATGKQHASATVVAAPVAGIVVLFLSGLDALGAFLVCVGCLSGVVLSPDLDQETVTRSEWWVIRHTLGAGWLWVWYWWLYARIVPHRGWASHAPIIGTIGRVSYISLPVLVAIWYFQPNFQPEDFAFLIPMFVGLVVADLLHWLMDMS